MIKILQVVGARPNFMKAAPVMIALSKCEGVVQTLVHTGQHYDKQMSDVFFEELGLPHPDVNLEVGSGSQSVQTAQIMMRFESVVQEYQPGWVVVYGDVNSTVATALVSAKLNIRIAHVEAGLRSNDRRMPEEINRLLTDQMADLLFTPSIDGNENLQREGIAESKIHLVGNVMIDTLIRLLPQAAKRWDELQLRFDLNRYALVTLHRPSNVDETATLSRLLIALGDIACELPVIFPIHPRTRARIDADEIIVPHGINLVDPLSYLDFLAMQQHATVVVTDSGGIQEETTYLGIPCLTLRENTERPVTVTIGTNLLLGNDVERLHTEVIRVLKGDGKRGQCPPLWDGHAADRIAQILVNA
jgi:UDP-N-acetylglucosamine 2-epimerase (non-hydrolysing)